MGSYLASYDLGDDRVPCPDGMGRSLPWGFLLSFPDKDPTPGFQHGDQTSPAWYAQSSWDSRGGRIKLRPA